MGTMRQPQLPDKIDVAVFQGKMRVTDHRDLFDAGIVTYNDLLAYEDITEVNHRLKLLQRDPIPRDTFVLWQDMAKNQFADTRETIDTSLGEDMKLPGHPIEKKYFKPPLKDAELAALQKAGITTLEQLSQMDRSQIAEIINAHDPNFTITDHRGESLREQAEYELAEPVVAEFVDPDEIFKPLKEDVTTGRRPIDVRATQPSASTKATPPHGTKVEAPEAPAPAPEPPTKPLTRGQKIYNRYFGWFTPIRKRWFPVGLRYGLLLVAYLYGLVLFFTLMWVNWDARQLAMFDLLNLASIIAVIYEITWLQRNREKLTWRIGLLAAFTLVLSVMPLLIRMYNSLEFDAIAFLWLMFVTLIVSIVNCVAFIMKQPDPRNA